VAQTSRILYNRYPELPTINTERLLLRLLRLEDASDVFEYASDPEVTRYTLWDTHESLRDTEDFIEWLAGNFACWALEHKADAKVIGTCFLHTFDFKNRQAEIAFNVARQYWNQGYATEAAREVVAFGLAHWELDRIIGTCMLPNIGSARVLEKIGMTYQGNVHKYNHEMRLYAISNSRD